MIVIIQTPLARGLTVTLWQHLPSNIEVTTRSLLTRLSPLPPHRLNAGCSYLASTYVTRCASTGLLLPVGVLCHGLVPLFSIIDEAG